MNTLAEMGTHLKAVERCEERPQQLADGIDQDKMRFIHEKRGISWQGIYEIIFPGAPVPTQCKLKKKTEEGIV